MNWKFLKKKRFWLGVAVVIIIGLVIFFSIKSNQQAVSYNTEKVKVGKLIQTVTATGAIESSEEITLNFRAVGKIANISVKEGSQVKAGQVLATLEMGSIGASIKQAEANLASAKANLEKVRAGASIEDVALTEQQLIKAENDYQSLLRESATQISILKDKLIDNLDNSVFTSQTALNTVYNDLINNETTLYLITSDSSLENKLNSDYTLMQERFNDLRLTISDAKKSQNQDEAIISASENARIFLNDLNNFLNSAYTLADKIIINTTYTQTKKDTIKSGISSQQTSNNTSLTSLQLARSNFVNGANSYQSQILSASNSVAISRAQLDLKKAGPRNFDVTTAQAQVAQAQASLDKIRADADDYMIKAPIDGQITAVNYFRGETPNSAESVIKMLSQEEYQIRVDISESDITKIKIGDVVKIELDAFGSDHIFSGVVSFIDPAQTVIKDVTYYKTIISFVEDGWNSKIKPGMTANITVISAEKDNVLYVPQRAVRVRSANLGEVPEKYVEVLVNGEVEEKVVGIGLRGDNGLVEITSGLLENEEVITFKKENK